MAFKDLLNKGMDLIQSGAKAVGDAAKEKKNAMQEYDLLKTRSEHIGPLSPYVVRNEDPQDGKEQLILNCCVTLSVENAKLINKALPIDETVIDVRTAKEAQTEIEFVLVATDKRLWIINKNDYMTKEYETIGDCEIVNKGMMAQGTKFDGKAFSIDGNEADVKRFFDEIKNPEYRKNVTVHKVAYLAGVVPVKQVLNMNLRGITLGANGEAVLHGGADNRVVTIPEIVSVQLMVNDTAALVKGRTDSSNFMSSPMEARKMAVKVVLGMGEYTIETMPQNMMNTSYRREDATYIANYDFAKLVVETLGELIKEDELKHHVNPNPGMVAGSAIGQSIMPNAGVVQGTMASQPGPQVQNMQVTEQVMSSVAPMPTTAIPEVNPAMVSASQPSGVQSSVVNTPTNVGNQQQVENSNEYPGLDVFHFEPKE